MNVVAWVMIFPSAIVALSMISTILNDKGNMWTVLTFFISLAVTAVSAGVIWGGLFQ